ncbi:MAG: NosD domain-containing protein [Archangium sp.]|nr:NosD domain-containing protein [Archangium sp.]
MTALLALVVLSAAGPVDRPCPQGAVLARTAAELEALLSGTEKDIWVAGHVVGDFEAKRPSTPLGTNGVRLHGCERAVLEGTGKGTVLKLHGDDVLVEDLTFQKSGIRTSFEDGALKITGERAMVRRVTVRDTLYGIAFEQCHSCWLEDADISGRPDLEENQRGDAVKLWEAHGSQVHRIWVHGMRDVVVWYSRHVTLEDNRITGGRYGTHFMYAHDSTVRRSVMRGNTVGIFVMYSARVLAEDNELSGARGPAGMGIGFKESDAVTLKRNLIVSNTIGTYLDYTPRDPKQPVLFEGNVLALNGVALRTHSSEHGASFIENDFLSNDVLCEVDGNGDARSIDFKGNYWAAYAGYDLDRDGFGDVAFQIKRASSDLSDSHPDLKFFHGTAAFGLYDAVATALPYFTTRLLLEDPRPAVRPHRELR